MFSNNSRTWRELMEEHADHRLKDWPLMSSPFPTIFICMVYMFIVKVAGPKFMEKRKKYDLRGVIVYYNFAQIIYSIIMFVGCGVCGWFTTYSLRCEPLDKSDNPSAKWMAIGCWWYFFSKFTEFFDTFFFILRKRFDLVSTLHVIHHGTMPITAWFIIKFTPGGHGSFAGFLNSFVHIIMYTYYMLAAMGPHMQKYLWWKKYLTILQMAQFVAIFVHAMQLNFYNPCNFPMTFVYWLAANAVLYLTLFMGFYRQAYTHQKTVRAHAKQNIGESNEFYVAKKISDQDQEKSSIDGNELKNKKTE